MVAVGSMDQDFSMFSAILNRNMTHIFNEERIAFKRVRKIAKSDYQLSVCPSVLPRGATRLPFDGLVFIEDLSRKLKFQPDMT